jgi:hypothetical protein
MYVEILIWEYFKELFWKVWFFQYDPERKHQNLKWKSPKSVKLGRGRWKSKCQNKIAKLCQSVCFYTKGITHYEFDPSKHRLTNPPFKFWNVYGSTLSKRTRSLAVYV